MHPRRPQKLAIWCHESKPAGIALITLLYSRTVFRLRFRLSQGSRQPLRLDQRPAPAGPDSYWTFSLILNIFYLKCSQRTVQGNRGSGEEKAIGIAQDTWERSKDCAAQAEKLVAGWPARPDG
jgi:hypothetical protein